jgi:hypothetical protein
MNTSYTKNNTSINFNAISPSGHKSRSGFDMNQLGIELDQVARDIVRKGILKGIPGADADELRQDAILMAIGWRLKGEIDPVSESEPPPGGPWSPERAIAGAMKFTKLRYFSDRSKRGERLAEITKYLGDYFETSFHCDFDSSRSNWPTETACELLKNAVLAAVQAGRLTRFNGYIAMRVYHELEPVTRVAKQCGVTRGAIYQRLDRMRPVIKQFIDRTEVTTFNYFLIHNSNHTIYD